jgi:hypothetical protein
MRSINKQHLAVPPNSFSSKQKMAGLVSSEWQANMEKDG